MNLQKNVPFKERKIKFGNNGGVKGAIIIVNTRWRWGGEGGGGWRVRMDGILAGFRPQSNWN